VKGQMLLATGRARDALPYFERAAATDPESMIAFARAAVAAGDLAKAREAATNAVRRSPGHPWAMAVLGHVLALGGERDAGVVYLRRAVEIGPRRPVVWESLADGFEAAGNPRLAAVCRREAASFR
jgi:predicted Zn-dependent protease